MKKNRKKRKGKSLSRGLFTHSSSLAVFQLYSLDFRMKLRSFSVVLLWHFAPFVLLKLIIKLVLT